MRPTALRLRNIRLHADTELDMSALQAAAIVGKNGAGKTTIVEGILRALFSEGVSILPSYLVTTGAQDASIELEFDHQGEHYRITRLGGRKSDLQFAVRNGDGWRALNGTSSKETQLIINRTLGMDEDLFLSSSCVMQGGTAGLCEATPAEAKALMYRIFEAELSRFERRHELAKVRVGAIDGQISKHEGHRLHLEAQVAAKTETQAEAGACEVALEAAKAELTKAEAELVEVRERMAAAKADQDRLAEVEKRMVEVKAEIERLSRERGDQSEILARCSFLLDKAAEIRAKCERAEVIEKQLECHAELQTKWLAIGEEYNTKKLELQESAAADAQENERKRRGLVEQLVKVQTELTDLEAKIFGCQDNLKVAKEQSALLGDVPCAGGPLQDTCQLLASARTCASKIPRFEQSLAEMVQNRDRVVSAVSTAKATLTEYDSATEEAKTSLQRKHEAELADIKRRAEGVGYDSGEHKACWAEFDALKQAREQLPAIAQAEERRKNALEQSSKIGEEISSRQGALEELIAESEEIGNNLIFAVSRFDIDNADRAIAAAKAGVDNTTRALATAQTKLASIAEAEAELKKLADELSGLNAERIVYATLQQAFGRDGIPALIIDAAIPQIEEYANDLLTLLSDGSLHVRMVTTKSTGSGERETLEILASDSRGERNFANGFSGGQKVRISLAVRVAIGMVLAQRAGSTIRTLLLDEVCGPLDQAGEDALVECIHKLQSLFDLIILITHREAMKDRLPQQIEVIANGAGAEVRVAA